MHDEIPHPQQTDAVVFTGVDTVTMQPLPVPALGPHDALVRTRYSTISAGTEGWVLGNRFTWAPTPFPCVPGYQRVGEIVALGAEVSGWRVGDRVLATNGAWDRSQTGAVASQWGAHIALAPTVESELYALPPGTDELDASAAVVAQVGYNAASRPQLEAGAWVVVYGDGLIGQCAAQAAQARGARVALVGRRADRLRLATMVGVDAVVNAREQPVVETVRQLTGARTVAAILDTVQTVEAQREYLPLLEYARGQIVYSGFTPAPTWADMALLQQNELTTYFVQGWTRPRMEATLALMAAGKLRVRPLTTHLVPAHEAPQMYAMIQRKDASFLGVTLDWRADTNHATDTTASGASTEIHENGEDGGEQA